MPFMTVRHEVQDYAAWKQAFDEHAPMRREMGSKGGYILRNADDPNELIVMMEVEDLDKARAFAASDELRQAMERAGVADQPDIYFMDLADRSEV